MKIDIHTHTKKIKQGDAVTRNIECDKFDEIIRKTDVKILAITNHNHFDLSQYETFRAKVSDVCQIWPGVELDIDEEGRKAHLIVIANPQQASQLSVQVAELLGQTSPDRFTVSLQDLADAFSGIDALYIAHYRNKKPNLADDDVDMLLRLIPNTKRLLKEAANAVSAGIFISHGHNSIHGSDVQDWNQYVEHSINLPDLRLPVESFEQFCLLLEKDESTINTILNKKTKEILHINPFGIAELMDLEIYNDINIVFGSKGTGKSDILKAISKHYNERGFRTSVYVSSAITLEEKCDLRGRYLDADAETLGLNDCHLEFRELRNATDKNVTSLSSYNRYFTWEKSNKIAELIKLTDIIKEDDAKPSRDFNQLSEIITEIDKFFGIITGSPIARNELDDALIKELNDVLYKIRIKLETSSNDRFIEWKSVFLLNHIVATFNREIERKTGSPSKPSSTGFLEYAKNRIHIEQKVKKIIDSMCTSIDPKIEDIGSLGEKGKLMLKTKLVVQDGSITDGDYHHLRGAAKTPQKKVAQSVKLIEKHIYLNSLFEKIEELNAIESGDMVACISDLIQFHRYFTLNDAAYTPSSGESSMVMLHRELFEEKEIYIIDEPEKSLGNDYISGVIVPILKERARSGKKVIIATHDANIAVRTLPYNSVYREHDIGGYFTYTGNPFLNSLRCIGGLRQPLDWKEISMKTLEGGKEAFGERGKIYGNI